MKQLLTISLISVFLLIGTKVYSQKSSWQFSVKAGMNLSNVTGDFENTKTKVGFNLGIGADYDFNDDIMLLTGLEYTMKGTKISSEKTTLQYLQIPIHFGFKIPVSENQLIVHGGPYLAYGVKGEAENDGVSINMFDFQGNTPLKRFDAGIGLGVRLDIKQIYVNFGYDYGLVDIGGDLAYPQYGIYAIEVKNSNFNFSLGYKF